MLEDDARLLAMSPPASGMTTGVAHGLAAKAFCIRSAQAAVVTTKTGTSGTLKKGAPSTSSPRSVATICA
ncbi:MAG TPA: hypothetical protein VHZ73_08135 [Vicinamibacterales bacterium]|jgi:hypothetical protein|nr:hypothetical protein [Vicinamibacterales bacterium]